METLGPVVLALLIALLVALSRRMRTRRRVPVAEDIVLGGRAEVVDLAVTSRLSSIKRFHYFAVAPGRHTLILSRVPAWAIIPGLLMFPIGLIFLLIRDNIRLDVAIFDGSDGTVARLSGETELVMLERARAALAELTNGTSVRI